MTMTVPTTVPTVRLRGQRLLRLALWIGGYPILPIRWRKAGVRWAMNRLSYQVNDGPVLPLWTITSHEAHWYMDA